MGFKDIIVFAAAIMKGQVRKLEDHHFHYKIKKWKKQVSFDIIHDISENVILLQLMGSVSNANNALGIFGYFIFDSNYKKAFLLTIDSLKLI